MLPRLILASQSPRRRELLSSIGVEFDVVPADVDETRFADEHYDDYVLRIATNKADKISKLHVDRPILSADTTVVAPNGDVLEKPLDMEDAQRMIRALQGERHVVSTAFCFKWADRDLYERQIVDTAVWMRSMTELEIKSYAQTGEGLDKAGGYALQGIGAAFFQRIEGSYTSVVGLPLEEVTRVLLRNNLWSADMLCSASQE